MSLLFGFKKTYSDRINRIDRIKSYKYPVNPVILSKKPSKEN